MTDSMHASWPTGPCAELTPRKMNVLTTCRYPERRMCLSSSARSLMIWALKGSSHAYSLQE